MSGPDDRPPAGAELAELAELARRAPDRIRDRLADVPLGAQAEIALLLPPRERLELLLHAPRPMRLVRTLPDAELYLSIREVGPTDALPLISLASAPQLLHLLDLEAWRRDRFDAKRCGAWVALLIEAGQPVLLRFLREVDDEMLALLFQKWARVVQIEVDDTPDRHGHGETESGTDAGFVSPDGYHRFRPVIPEHMPAVRRLAEVLAAHHPERYQRLIWAALWETGPELEEEAGRWRQSRLEEHGFPPWDEAVEVYAPPTGTRIRTDPPAQADEAEAAAPRLPLRVAAAGGLLCDAVVRLEEPHRDRVLHETMSLANRLLVADAADTGDPDAHRAALGRAAAYINVALGTRGATDGSTARAHVLEVPVTELFREGYGLAAELASKARTLVKTGWASGHARAAELLDAPIGPAVEGLLRARPAYFDTREGNVGDAAYRDFRTLGEIDETRAALRMADALGTVFVTHLGVDLGVVLRDDDTRLHPIRFSTLFLTALAWSAVDGSLRGEPLTPEALARFLRTVASHRTADPDAAPRALEDFVGLVARSVDLGAAETAAFRAFGRASLEKLSEECAGLDPGVPVDPRYVSCLMIRGD